MADRAQAKDFAQGLEIPSDPVDIFHHLEQTSGLGFQIVSMIRILLFPGLFRISDFGFHCNVLCCVLGAAGAKIHSGLSAGSWLGELRFSQRFSDFLNRFVVPSEQNHPSVNRGFNVMAFILTEALYSFTILIKRLRWTLSTMQRLVLDSSAVILLTKCGLLEIACATFEILVPPSVVSETASRELSQKHPDAAFVRDLLSRGLIKTTTPSGARPRIPVSLHRGEADALRVALSMPDSFLATDDGRAIKAARFAKVRFIITPKIVVELFRLRKVSFSEARRAIVKLGKVGRYSPDIIADAMFSLTEVRDGKTNNRKSSGRTLERNRSARERK
jgi:predicted nucleic acid-binding protein